MKTVIVLIGPSQLEALIGDLQAGLTTPETKTIALVLSEQAIQAHGGAFTFPQETKCYVGPIYTLGFKASLEEIQRQLHDRNIPN